jgi:hypothetical protein
MIHAGTRDLLFAVIAALLLAAAAWLWRRAQPWQRVNHARTWLWNALHKKQLRRSPNYARTSTRC